MAKRKRKIGRPSRDVASNAALAGVDLSTLDPIAVLRAIAGDASAPASARVAAARALIADERRGGQQPDDHPQNAGDAVARHALRILRGGKK
jgi:hypothetical protein